MAGPDRRPAHLVAALLCVVAFLHARSLTRGLEWPALNIQYREIAAAQSILDGNPRADTCYRGELSWYNPMSAWILVAATQVSDVPLPRAVVAIGPWINLLAPAGFYLLAVALFGPWTAVAALGAFLFLTGNASLFTDAATYSPWFAAENYGQGLFYAAVAWIHVNDRNDAGPTGDLVSGALLGLVFLVHTAPAIILGTIHLVMTGHRIAESRRAGPPLLRLGTTLAAALAASAPIVLIVIGHYHLRVLNPFPSMAPIGIFGSLSALGIKLLTASPLLIAAAAFTLRDLRRPGRLPRVVRAWLLANTVLLAWVGLGLVSARLGRNLVPRVPVPGFHFLCYAMALVSLGVGVALTDVSVWMAERLGSRRVKAAPEVILLVLLAIMLGVAAPRYLRRPDATDLREEARQFQAAFPAGLYRWLRESARPDDVVLCTDAESLFVVAPAGRKVVATNRYFSNPFVDWAARDLDREAMYENLRRNDAKAFDALATKYDVRWVVVPTVMNDDLRRLAGVPSAMVPAVSPRDLEVWPGLSRVWGDDRYVVFRRGAPPLTGKDSSSSSLRRDGSSPARFRPLR